MYENRNDHDVTLETYNSITSKLSELGPAFSRLSCFLGFDGYVDSLYSLALTRRDVSDWTRMESMKTLGERILNVAGSSANIERVLKRKISGGFAPNSCKAINSLGVRVILAAAIGYPQLVDVFKAFEDNANIDVKSFNNPGETCGLEFDDGKVMLTDFENIFNISWSLLLERIGLDSLINMFQVSDIMGFGHWSLIPNLDEIWDGLMGEIFPKLDDPGEKLIFVDLADIKKRTPEDILQMLNQLKQMNETIPVLLSLNDQEAIDISKVLEDVPVIDKDKEHFKDYAAAGLKINQEAGISYLVIHSPHFATISTPDNHYWVTEGFTSKPRFTTGAGDHFHSGVAASLAAGFEPPEAILIGNALTAVFVRTGNSPNVKDLTGFIEKYMEYIENDNPDFP